VLKHTRDALGVVASSQSSWSRWLGCRLPCRSILDLGRPPSEADHRSQLPKLTALYSNSLSSLWIRLRRDPFEARPLTERDRWTGSDLEWQSLVWQCCSPDAHRRSAMPMWDRTPAAASTPAQTLMWDRSTRRRSTKARSWQNGLDDHKKGLRRCLNCEVPWACEPVIHVSPWVPLGSHRINAPVSVI
jgi:hypothetical protein